MTLAISPSTCSSKTGTWPASPASLPVNTLATISPVSASRDELRPAIRDDATAPAQGSVIGNGEIKTEEAQHAACEALGLVQRQVEDEPQGQHQLDRQVRIASLTAWCGPPWSLPFSNGGLIEPEDQVTAP